MAFRRYDPSGAVYLTNQVALQLDSSVRQLVSSANQLVRMHRATLPQWYGASDLCRRWRLGQGALIKLLEREISYRGQTGKRLRVHLDDVLRIDEEMKRQEEVRKEMVRRGLLAGLIERRGKARES